LPLPLSLQLNTLLITAVSLLDNSLFVLLTDSSFSSYFTILFFKFIFYLVVERTVSPHVLWFHLPNMEDTTLVETLDIIQGVDLSLDDIGIMPVPLPDEKFLFFLLFLMTLF
jgi:hypothetical protein